MKLLIFCLVVSFSAQSFSLKVFTETTWHRGIRVGEYRSYSSVNLAKYSVPYNTLRSTWLFRAERNHEDCESRTVNVYLQHGSFPLINPLNESFPERFYLKRTNLQEIQLHATNSTQIKYLEKPLRGNWFIATILGDYVDDSIKQKGIGLDCRYYLSVTHIIEAYETVDTLITDTPHQQTAQDGLLYLYKFHTSKKTWQYNIKVTNCSYTPSNFSTTLDNSTSNSSTFTTARKTNSTCPLALITRSQALPEWDEHTKLWTDCEGANASSCSVEIPNPPTNDWSYISFRSAEPEESNGSLTFTLLIELTECILTTDEEAEVVEQIDQVANNGSIITNASLSSVYADEVTDTEHSIVQTNKTQLGLRPAVDATDEKNISSCMKIEELGRYEQPYWAFQVRFSARIGIMYLANRVVVSDEEVLVMSFVMQSIIDSGGTLYFTIELAEQYLNDSSQIVTVESCIQRLGIPMSLTGVQCEDDLFQVLNTSASNSSHLYFPYPEAGPWFITYLAKCYSRAENSPGGVPVREPCRQNLLLVYFELELGACAQGCGEYGYCREYYSGVLHFASCVCTAKYRGFACDDDTVALSDTVQLTSTLLLTLSNLAFLPAIIVATYRRFYVEALVYFYTMFCSTFYHACDGDSKYTYCLMPFNVLSHCDFFGAILSVWLTLIAMARLAESRRTFLLVLGCLGLAIGVTWDKHSLGVFLVPSAVALGIMTVSWGFQCHRRRQCYPPLRRWLFYLIPGVLVAGAGLIIFALFETESNYRYTHSTWHACMALCILLLLPPRHVDNKASDSDDNDSYHGVSTVFPCGSNQSLQSLFCRKYSQIKNYVMQKSEVSNEETHSMDLVKVTTNGVTREGRYASQTEDGGRYSSQNGGFHAMESQENRMENGGMHESQNCSIHTVETQEDDSNRQSTAF